MKNRYKYVSLLLVFVIVAFCISLVGCKENQSKNTNVGAGKFLNFASKTDDFGSCDFYWNYADDSIIDSTKITVSSSLGEEIHTFKHANTLDNYHWNIVLEKDIVYYFTFTSYLKNIDTNQNPIIGATVNCSRINLSHSDNPQFPRVEIDTENSIWPTCEYVAAPRGYWGAGITNAKYVQSKVSIFDRDNNLVYSSYNTDEDYQGAKVKVRGNTSAYYEKQPLKIKVATKIDLLSGLLDGRDDKNYKSKDWVLLSQGQDIKQILGCTIAETVGVNYVPKYEYVYLIVNGDFRGVYILTESVSKGSGEGNEQSRVPISESGFIIEQDAYWWNEDLYFETPLTKKHPAKYTFKYPDPDDINSNSAQYKYIKDYVSSFENAMKDGKDYLSYIDIESFAKWILVHNYLATYDAGGSNIYFYKYDETNNSKLCMGPVWDFDSIFGCGIESNAAIFNSSYLFITLSNNTTFKEVYNKLFENTKKSIITNLESKLNNYMIYQNDFDMLIQYDNLRWNRSFEKLSSQIQSNLSWMYQHVEWLETNLNT